MHSVGPCIARTELLQRLRWPKDERLESPPHHLQCKSDAADSEMVLPLTLHNPLKRHLSQHDDPWHAAEEAGE